MARCCSKLKINYMKIKLLFVLLYSLISIIYVRGQNNVSIKFYKDFTSGLYYRDSSGITRKANTIEISNLNKLNHNQKWTDSVLAVNPPVYTDTIFCDLIYINVSTWSTTNNKVAPLPLQVRIVKWIRPQQFPDGVKWFSDNGTSYDVIWARIKGLIYIPIKNYR